MERIPSLPRLPPRTVFLQAPQCPRHRWVCSPSKTRTWRNYRPLSLVSKLFTSTWRNRYRPLCEVRTANLGNPCLVPVAFPLKGGKPLQE